MSDAQAGGADAAPAIFNGRHERPPLVDGEVLATSTAAGDGWIIRVYRPILDPSLADAVEATHRAALRRHGVDGLTTRGPLRAQAATWMLVATPEGGGPPCGGIRVELADERQPLPIEAVLRRFGPDLCALLTRDLADGAPIGELTGLWVRDAWRGRGLARALVEAGLAAARRAGTERLFGLVPPHTMPHFLALGARVHHDLGDNGRFPYPTPAYSSTVVSFSLERTAAASQASIAAAGPAPAGPRAP